MLVVPSHQLLSSLVAFLVLVVVRSHSEEGHTDTASAAEKDKITISHQGAVYWALPIFIAQEKGYFASLNLEPSYRVYDNGADQVNNALSDNPQWDLGAAGVVPNILAGQSRKIDTIGISNDESSANVIIGRTASTPYPITNVLNTPIALTPNSTVHYVVEACLAKDSGVTNFTDLPLIYNSQSQVIQRLRDNNTQYGGLWAPNSYQYLMTAGKELCSGTTAGVVVPGGIMYREGFEIGPDGQVDQAKRDIVNRALAAWMRAIKYIQNPDNRSDVLALMKQFYSQYNVVLVDADYEKEIDTRPLFNLDQQLEVMSADRSATNSALRWYNDVTAFLEKSGVLSPPAGGRIIEPAEYLSRLYLAEIKANSDLYAFAQGQSTSAGGRIQMSILGSIIIGLTLFL